MRKSLRIISSPVQVLLSPFLYERVSISFLISVIAMMLGLTTPAAHAQSTQIESLRLWHSPDKTRIVFDISAGVRYKTFSLDNPRRLVVDIEDGGLRAELPKLKNNQHISGMRSGQPKPKVFRVVFELKREMQSNAFVLTPNELYGHRLVVDLIEANQPKSAVALTESAAPAIENSSPKTAASNPQAKTDGDRKAQTRLQIAPAKNKLKIALDAGHGGEDPGAIGHRGSREKKITLSIAKRLKTVIDKDPRMEAFLVRTGDYYIKLHQRRQMAREKGADIFISIHADAFKRRSANGLSVFALSQRGATSAMASALAAKENASDLIGGVSLANKDEVLAKVLVDLSMTATISDSVNLGGRVLKELSKVGRLHSKRVEQAGFAVLKSPDMPSILIETGFITNPDEERKLRTSRYQQKIAEAVYRAITDFYAQTPYFNSGQYASPQVTASNRVSSVSNNDRSKNSETSLIKHKVKRGDTLSELAEKYGTTMASIKRENKLKRNTLWLGETLRIQSSKSSAASVSTPKTHVVKRGDSLSKISAKYNISIAYLKRLNGLKKSVLFPGQTLTISAANSTAPVKKDTVHIVKRGDTLSEIAERYGASMRAIIKLNKLSSRTVYLGQRLKIPG